MPRQRLATIVCLAVFLVGAACLYPLQKRFDRVTGGGDQVIEETLYLPSGTTIKRMSIGFDGVVSDLYWIRTVQYFGRKLFGGLGGSVNVEMLSQKNMPMLAPMLNIVVTVDPQYMIAYSYGANFLGEFDLDSACRLLKQGIENTKKEIETSSRKDVLRTELARLYSQLGYTYWRARKFDESSQAYLEGSQVPGAPKWMELMAFVMKSRGGDRATSYKVFERQRDEADDQVMRATADYRLRHLVTLDERDFYNRMLNLYVAQNGHCPTDLNQLLPLIKAHVNEARDSLGRPLEKVLQFDQTGTPVDTGDPPAPYALDPQTCKVELGPNSSIPKYWDTH